MACPSTQALDLVANAGVTGKINFKILLYHDIHRKSTVPTPAKYGGTGRIRTCTRPSCAHTPDTACTARLPIPPPPHICTALLSGQQPTCYWPLSSAEIQISSAAGRDFNPQPDHGGGLSTSLVPLCLSYRQLRVTSDPLIVGVTAQALRPHAGTVTSRIRPFQSRLD